MKEQLQDKLVEIITSIQAATGKAADFAMTELPDVAQQYIEFGRVFEPLIAVCLFLLAVGFVFLTVQCFKHVDEGPSIFPGTVVLVSAFLFLCQLKDAIMVWTAPKVWLLLELSRLIK